MTKQDFFNFRHGVNRDKEWDCLMKIMMNKKFLIGKILRMKMFITLWLQKTKRSIKKATNFSIVTVEERIDFYSLITDFF